MTTKDLIKLSTRIFIARKGRTMLTVLGMGIGFGAILFLVSLGYGLQDALLRTNTLTTLDVSPNAQEGKIITAAAVDEMRKIDGVELIEPGYDFKARIKLDDAAIDVRATVANPDFFSLEGSRITAGKKLEKSNSKEVLVSSAFEKILGKNSDDLIGQEVSFSLFGSSSAAENEKEKSQAQTAVFEASGYTISGVMENEETVFYVTLEGINIPSEISFSKLKAKCNSSDALASVREAITQKGFSVTSLSETVSEVSRLFDIANVIMTLFGIITLAVSAIGMFNTMTVALLERTTEIGIMRSIGASRMDILLMFIIESTLMGFCGGIAGIILGVLSGQIVNLVINVAAGRMGGKPLDIFSYPLWFLGLILAFSIVIGFTTGIGPARRASRLDPLEALRSR